MTRPWRRRTMPRSAARVRRKAAVRLISMTACQSSSRRRSARASRVMPALLTRMSIWPIAASASRTRRSDASGSARSAVSACARSPEFGDERVERGPARPGNRDRGALAVERPGDRAADAAGGAGHQRSLPGQIEHPAYSRWTKRFDFGRGADRERRERAVDPLDEPGQDAPGADLDDLLDLVGGEQQHALAPAHHLGRPARRAAP